ncbi:hypothetical protein M231_01113 [Tremella mesenterica]|uniref:chitin deacetylase n=1 Tax=Tremella mesenterica TaxID=5217 RepID=A0A4Q1BU41_TREME|nr:hypothetical protein M231_01113 [Tremella mesenterica]
MSSLVNVLLILLHLSTSVRGHHGCGGGEIMRRNLGGKLIERTSPTDEASAAAIQDITQECTPYSYAPLLQLAPLYPTTWETASILPNDTDALALFQQISQTISSNPSFNLAPKGTPEGDFSAVQYNGTDVDCWWPWQGCTQPAPQTGLPDDITSVPEGETWGLGFDDGPNCSHNALYDFLLEQNQKATVFYIGSNVYDWPLQSMRAIKDGHHVCVHTWSHQYMTAFTNDVAFAELYYARQIIKDILGVTPLCWRPPYGNVDNRIRAIAEGLNLTTIIWSDDTNDWKVGDPTVNVTEADVNAAYQIVVKGATNGTYKSTGPVVLNHELNNFTMSEFIKEYPSMKSAFTHIVPMAAAMNWTHPYVEQNIVYPDFAAYIGGQTNVTIGPSITSSASASKTSTPGIQSGSASVSGGSNSTAGEKNKEGQGSGAIRFTINWNLLYLLLFAFVL